MSRYLSNEDVGTMTHWNTVLKTLDSVNKK